MFCWCGHHARYHRTQTPNKCSKCEECPYYRPRQNANLRSRLGRTTMKARFDGICKSCGLEIKAGEHDITNDDSGKWIHKGCHPDENQPPV